LGEIERRSGEEFFFRTIGVLQWFRLCGNMYTKSKRRRHGKRRKRRHHQLGSVFKVNTK
jgi:hypothetical protein